MLKGLLLLALLALMATGCGGIDTISEGYKHSQEVADDLGRAIGTRPFVGFNWHNGVLTNVTVTFEGIPKGRTTEELAALSRSSISTRFKQPPQNVVISFRLPGKGS